MKVAEIKYQSRHALMYRVPSKSKPGETHIVEYGPGTKKSCTCPGVEWFERRGIEHMKLCRHQRMSTIELADPPSQSQQMYHMARELVRDKSADLCTVWGNIKCLKPEHYDEYAIHCEGCRLYPEICNIHRIRYGRRHRKVPLIWRLQTALYRRERKKARRLLHQIVARSAPGFPEAPSATTTE